jgi:type II secretory pathway component GspD/PulD (secretin)
MSRRLRSLTFGAMTCALFAGLGLLRGQEGEKAGDEPGQAQSRRGARGRRGANGDSELPPGAPPVGRFTAAGAPPQNPDKEPVDATRNRRLAVKIKHAPAQMLSTTVGKQYTGVPGVFLVAEPTSNSLLISAPAEFFEEILKTLKGLDRAPPSIAAEVTIVEFAAAVEKKEAGKDGRKSIRAADFEGPADKVREKLEELEKSRQVQRLKRFQLKAVNNQTAQVQDSEDKPGAQVAAAAAAAPAPAPAPVGFAGRGGIPFAATGTIIQFTARAAEGYGVLMELSVHDSPRLAAGDGAEGAAKDGEKADQVASKFLGTVSIPAGEAVVASEIERNLTAGRSRIFIIVTAKVIDPEAAKLLPEGDTE